ncbi:hypothetical protein MMC11_001445 [Xylographa trunciseda]|nr:hypothetical protein [Xylographa trunciseda]
MATIQFSSIPTDVHYYIAGYLGVSSLLSLCRVCKSLNLNYTSALYRHVDLSMHNRGLVLCNRSGDIILHADHPFCENVPKRMRARQERFIQTMLSQPAYRLYVQSLAWTFLVLDQWDDDLPPDAPSEVYQAPLTELWPVLQDLPNVLSVDVAHIDPYLNIYMLGSPPNALFPSATSVRLVGRLDYIFAISILRAVDPARLVSLCLDNVQDEGQMNSKEPYKKIHDICTADQIETREADGERGCVVEGGMRGLLTHLTGRCTALRELVLRKAGQERKPDSDWHEKADEEVYEEWALFIKSTKQTLQRLVLEQGLGSWGEGRQKPPWRSCRGGPPWQEARPMDQRFMRILFPVLASGGWLCLESMDIRGVGSWEGVPAMDELKRAELRMAIGDRAALVVKEAASKTLEHIGIVPVRWFAYIPTRYSED